QARDACAELVDRLHRLEPALRFGCGIVHRTRALDARAGTRLWIALARELVEIDPARIVPEPRQRLGRMLRHAWVDRAESEQHAPQRVRARRLDSGRLGVAQALVVHLGDVARAAERALAPRGQREQVVEAAVELARAVAVKRRERAQRAPFVDL